MSESAAKRQPIDLDEFEKRLRAPAAPRGAESEDPLAELARLVGGGPDPFAPIFAAGRPDARPLVKAPARGKADDWDRLAAAPPPAALDQTRDLRGTLGEKNGFEQTSARPSAHDPRRDDADYAEPPLYTQESPNEWDGESAARRDWNKEKRSRKSIYMMSSALLLVVAGIGGTLALRGHVVRAGTPPTILAAAGPVKVKPPKTPSSDPVERSSSFLNQPASATVAAAHVVNSEEEPIDLSQATGSPPSSAQAAEGSAAAPPSDGSFFPKPHRVKTVSVRPDGSIISADGSDAPATSASASAPKAAAPVTAAAPELASDPDAASAPDSDPDLASAPIAKPEPAPAPPPIVKPRPAEAKRAVTKPSPFKSVARIPTTAATQLAALEPTSSLAATHSTPAASGGWAVQLAAPGSEQEARGEIGRLAKKYASELGGHKLGYHSANAKGRTVWRVRVAGLAQPDALALCNKIKGGGGACFVAKD